LIKHDGLAGAIMDSALADGDSVEVCAQLKAKGIPYVTYSGYSPPDNASLDAPHIVKPARMETFLTALVALLPAQRRSS
jgi:hypothetical protein